MTYQILDRKRQILVKKESKDTLRRVKKIIFDFDGVIAQTNKSYRQTIREVVDYYFLEILKLEGEKGKLVSLNDIQKFKDTGLYNNDWKLSYSFIQYYLTIILENLQEKKDFRKFFEKIVEIKFSNLQNFIKKLIKIGEFIKLRGINANKLVEKKTDMNSGLDFYLDKKIFEKSENVTAFELDNQKTNLENKDMILKKLIPYSLEKPDLLKRLFEERYLGKEIFTKIYRKPSVFNFESSLIDIEDFIPTEDTMNYLLKEFGKFGIYSGRPKPQGNYILRKFEYLEYFNENESIFLGDTLKSQDQMEKFGKPDPTLFIEMIEKNFEKKTSIVYVGDGVADILLVNKAKEEGIENISFLGVVSSSEDTNKLFIEFNKHEADAILKDVNDIPYLFKNLGSV
jgi:phosphoglycolate phosphatase-like HAD superfamily hydrolase